MLVPTLTVEVHDEARQLVQNIARAAVKSEAGVASEGDAAAYSLVWELGNLRQTKKGPKTVRGVNLMTGASVWLSTQAPTGYVRVNEAEYAALLQRAGESLDFEELFSGGGAQQQLNDVTRRVGESCLDLIRNTAPIDSGALRDSFVLLENDDADLQEAEGDDGIVSASLT